jgi:DNA-binding Lrp family transcriptional regulator
MAKRSKEQIEHDEKKIISELQNNARESIDIIAKKCGFSRQKVWRIINRLEDTKHIWGYTAIVDEETQDLKHFIALIKRTQVPVDEKVTDNIQNTTLDELFPKSNLKLENSLYVHGKYDWLISFYAKDIVEAKQYCERLNKRYHGYIADIELLETILPLIKHTIQNPNQTKLKEYY